MYSTNDFRAYRDLSHSGVLGMKWHKRRYQNYDGSLTPLGRIHYGVGEGRRTGGTSEPTKAQKAIENDAADYKTQKEKIKAVTEDCWSPELMDYRAYRNGTDKKLVERANAAADLGLKAIDKLRGPNYIDWDDYKENPRGERQWFLFEDQTIGHAMVADLVNQGYSANQVSKMIDIVEKNWDYDLVYDNDRIDKENSRVAMFEIREGNWNNELKSLAKACEEIKNETGNPGIRTTGRAVGLSKDELALEDYKKTFGKTAWEEVNDRDKRAREAAKLEDKINRLQKKKPTDKRIDKLTELSNLRDLKISDLSDDEIEYARRKYVDDINSLKVMATGFSLGGPVGSAVANLGYKYIHSLTAEGKKTKELEKSVREEHIKIAKDKQKRFDPIYQNPDGSLTREGKKAIKEPSKSNQNKTSVMSTQEKQRAYNSLMKKLSRSDYDGEKLPPLTPEEFKMYMEVIGSRK